MQSQEPLALQHQRLIQKMRREFGQDVINLLFEDNVTEIILNDDGFLWVERLGFPMEKIGKLPESQAAAAIKSVAAFWKGFATEEQPIVEAVMPIDGVSRFAGVLPPVVKKPSFCIRRHTSKVVTFDDYIKSGIMSEEDRDIICSRIQQKDNILVAGGTGSGKTTLLNTCISHAVSIFPNNRRIIMEDTAELKRVADNCKMLQTSVHVSLLALLKLSLRLRPDSIDVGEVRDGSAHTLLKAWTTDHPGGFASIHANKGELGALLRLEQLCLEVVPNPMNALIAEAIGLVINITKTKQGRTISHIISVDGFKDGKYITRNLCKNKFV
ncbi:P-type conjugative transfer ATPase TrbB [Commensalibacter nepenthis]|uniref:P-type conjugative transfer ATPase TrbB n=1 Tax=Commensalibacter nepenthis TaxID=3043872 RepID=A0ABT6QAF7_9PROT|nr:P-type conjugative transfer ATPase TrbB [Commensalibacter sp. TBRC 10068]MDI2113893.1 P-type conjugative transfer ATPase TrbB [Commensalibacter sp. TBRC 10068]